MLYQFYWIRPQPQPTLRSKVRLRVRGMPQKLSNGEFWTPTTNWGAYTFLRLVLPVNRVNRPNLISKKVGTSTEVIVPVPVGLQLCAPAFAGSPTVQSLAFPEASHLNRAYLCLHGFPTCDHAVEHQGKDNLGWLLGGLRLGFFIPIHLRHISSRFPGHKLRICSTSLFLMSWIFCHI